MTLSWNRRLGIGLTALALCLSASALSHRATSDDSPQKPVVEFSVPQQMLIPVAKPSGAKVTFDIYPNSWRGKATAFYGWIEGHLADGEVEKKYFDGNGAWQPFTDYAQAQPLKKAPLDDVHDFDWTVFDHTDGLAYGWVQVNFCMALDNGSALNPYDPLNTSCSWVGLQLNGVDKVTARNDSGSLRAASVSMSTGVAMGTAESTVSSVAAGKVQFDVQGSGSNAAFILAADGPSPLFTNTSLAGVRVTLYPIEDNGTVHDFPVARLVNGVADFSGIHPFNAQALNPGPQFQQAMSQLGAEMGIHPGMSAADLQTKFSQPDNLLATVSPQTMQMAKVALQTQSTGLLQAMSVPFAFQPRSGSPTGFLVMRPIGRGFRVVVEAADGVQPFAVNAMMVPLVTIPSSAWQSSALESTNSWGVALQADRVLRAEVGEPDEALPQHPSPVPVSFAWGRTRARYSGFLPLFDPPTWDPPADCKEWVNSKPAKFWGSLETSAINGGIAAEIGGAVAGAEGLGLTEATAKVAGPIAGLLTGALQSASDWVDFENYAIRFLTVSALHPYIKRVELKVANPNLCVHPVLQQDIGRDKTEVTVETFNPCDMPLYGFGGTGYGTQVKPAQVGDLTDQGYLHGIADGWGTGQKYEFQAITPGTATIKVRIPNLGMIDEYTATINVTKCASPINHR